MAVISMRQFLEAGVHFGHQTKRWHPKMSPYIYGIKNGVHVIDLRQTLTKLKEAYEYVKASAEEGRVPLFVGTKTQIQRIVKEEADRCGSPYINFRWLGGLLTNFGTVKQSIARMKTFEEIAGDDGNYEGVIKKEALMMERKRVKLERSLGGVRNMKSIPSMLFITDCHREQLALREAQKLGIPVVGISDTNCDPTGIDFMIPGNDDSPRAVALYANVISTAVLEGLAVRKQTRIESIPEEKAPARKAKTVTKDFAASFTGFAANSAPVKGDLWMLGEINTPDDIYTNKAGKLFKITTLNRNEDQEILISAMEYVPNVYVDSDEFIDFTPTGYTDIISPFVKPPIPEFDIRQLRRRTGDGSVVVDLLINPFTERLNYPPNLRTTDVSIVY